MLVLSHQLNGEMLVCGQHVSHLLLLQLALSLILRKFNDPFQVFGEPEGVEVEGE